MAIEDEKEIEAKEQDYGRVFEKRKQERFT